MKQTGLFSPIGFIPQNRVAPGAARFLRSHRRGFTLLEIMVSLVVVAILVAVGIQAASHAVMAAQRSTCQSNLRQLGIALLGHAAEHHGRLPATQHFLPPGSTDSWVFVLADRLDNLDEVRVSPADPRREERIEAGGTSYVLNGFLDSMAMDPFGNPLYPQWSSIERLPRPAETYMAFIGSERRGIGAGNDHVHGSGWRSWARVLADISPDLHRVGPPAEDHDEGSANYLMADGRVINLDAAEVKKEIESGNNIAIPPNLP